MPSVNELKSMINEFGLSELKLLMEFAGRNTFGKIYELQARAFDLLKLNSKTVEEKIQELYTRRSKRAGNSWLPIKSEKNSSQSTAGRVSSPVICEPSASPQERSFEQCTPPVKLKELPFFEIVSVLMKPSALVRTTSSRLQESFFQFDISRDDETRMLRSYLRIYLRCCILDLKSEQDDEFPPSLCIKVNGRNCKLFEAAPDDKCHSGFRVPGEPVDITRYCKSATGATNSLIISWAADCDPRGFVVGVYLVHPLQPGLLATRLQAQRFQPASRTWVMVGRKLSRVSGSDGPARSLGVDEELEEISPTLKASLICPISKRRIRVPCRSTACTHLQCFDARAYLALNERQPRWICPICKSHARYDSLYVDGLFSEILDKAPPLCTEVNFPDERSWVPAVSPGPSKAPSWSTTRTNPVPRRDRNVELIDLAAEPDDANRSPHLPITAAQGAPTRRDPYLRRPHSPIRNPVAPFSGTWYGYQARPRPGYDDRMWRRSTSRETSCRRDDQDMKPPPTCHESRPVERETSCKRTSSYEKPTKTWCKRGGSPAGARSPTFHCCGEISGPFGGRHSWSSALTSDMLPDKSCCISHVSNQECKRRTVIYVVDCDCHGCKHRCH